MLMYYIWWEITRVKTLEELSLEELKNSKIFKSEEELEDWLYQEFKRIAKVSDDIMSFVNVNMWFFNSLLEGRYNLYYVEDTGTFLVSIRGVQPRFKNKK